MTMPFSEKLWYCVETAALVVQLRLNATADAPRSKRNESMVIHTHTQIFTMHRAALSPIILIKLQIVSLGGFGLVLALRIT